MKSGLAHLILISLFSRHRDAGFGRQPVPPPAEEVSLGPSGAADGRIPGSFAPIRLPIRYNHISCTQVTYYNPNDVLSTLRYSVDLMGQFTSDINFKPDVQLLNRLLKGSIALNRAASDSPI